MNAPTAREELPYNPHETDICTEALFECVAEYDFIFSYLMFIVGSASSTDHVLKTTSLHIQDEKLHETFSQNIVFRRVQYYGPLLSRNIVTDLANNFLVYLSEILQKAAKKRPEILRSNERITTEDILQFENVSDIVSFIADRKISELSYGGLRETERFIKDRLGLELFDNQKQRELLTILVELRNIQAHNRGRINELFLKRVGDHSQTHFKFIKGETYQADFDAIIALSNNAIKIAVDMDEKIANKFRLPRSEFKSLYSKLRADREARLKRMPLPHQP